MPTTLHPDPLFRTVATCLLAILLIGCLSASMADSSGKIYRYQASDGSIVFTDQPRHNATRVELGITQTIQATPVKRQDSPAEPVREEAPVDADNGYSSLVIDSPQDDQAIRNNAGELTVTVSSQPVLNRQRGDRLVLMLDDAPLGPALETAQQKFTNIDRGSHRLQAIIVDKDDRVLIRSPAITFHMLRVSALLNKP